MAEERLPTIKKGRPMQNYFYNAGIILKTTLKRYQVLRCFPYFEKLPFSSPVKHPSKQSVTIHSIENDETFVARQQPGLLVNSQNLRTLALSNTDGHL